MSSLGSIDSLIGKEGMAVKMCAMPQWYSVEALRAHMKQIREEDEDFKKRSSQCSKNRLRNECQRVCHRQGSISAEGVKINQHIDFWFVDGVLGEKGKMVYAIAVNYCMLVL
ncbi:A-kinase anchor protein 13 [Bienertia sinuspersici]